MCECYQIGGPFIAEDPDCPVHGREAQRMEAEREAELAELNNQLAAWQERFPQYEYRPQDGCVALRLDSKSN